MSVEEASFMRSHHVFLVTLVAAVGMTTFAVVELGRAGEIYGDAVSSYSDTSVVNSVLVLSAGSELASGRSVTGLGSAFEAANARAASAVARLEASSPWWDGFGHPERKRLIELARQERDLTWSIGESVRKIGSSPPEEWSAELGSMRRTTLEYEKVHREVVEIAE